MAKIKPGSGGARIGAGAKPKEVTDTLSIRCSAKLKQSLLNKYPRILNKKIIPFLIKLDKQKLAS